MKPNALVVEGSVTVRMDLRAALTSAGFAVSACDSKLAAQNILRSRPCALVVVAPVLADGDGVALLDELRAAPELASIPVIMLCNESELKRRGEGPKSVADAYVAKPYEHAALIRCAQRLTAHKAPDHPSKRILTVDDSATYRDTLARALALDGFEVVPACSAEEAIDRLRVERVDCVLMDLEMPGMGGIEGARRIRSEPAWRDIPIVILTAHDDEPTRRRVASVGVDGFVIKSPEPALIRVHLRTVLRRREPDSLFDRVLAASGLSAGIGPTTIRRACARAGVDPQAMTRADLLRALPAIQESIRVFFTEEEHRRRVEMLAGVAQNLVSSPAARADPRRS